MIEQQVTLVRTWVLLLLIALLSGAAFVSGFVVGIALESDPQPHHVIYTPTCTL